MDLRLVAIRTDARTVYRFLFVTPPARTAELEAGFHRTTHSFRGLSAQEAAAAKPPHIRIVTVAAGDTVDSLSRRMAFQNFAAQRLRVLNGLGPGEQPKPGNRVKLVVE